MFLPHFLQFPSNLILKLYANAFSTWTLCLHCHTNLKQNMLLICKWMQEKFLNQENCRFWAKKNNFLKDKFVWLSIYLSIYLYLSVNYSTRREQWTIFSDCILFLIVFLVLLIYCYSFCNLLFWCYIIVLLFFV